MSEFEKKAVWKPIPSTFTCLKCEDDAISIFTYSTESETSIDDYDLAECRICGINGTYHQDMNCIVWE